jgi:hypothetical protein
LPRMFGSRSSRCFATRATTAAGAAAGAAAAGAGAGAGAEAGVIIIGEVGAIGGDLRSGGVEVAAATATAAAAATATATGLGPGPGPGPRPGPGPGVDRLMSSLTSAAPSASVGGYHMLHRPRRYASSHSCFNPFVKQINENTV